MKLGKTDGYSIRFNGASEAHNRSLHCTQGGTDEVRVDSEGLRQFQPAAGKVDIIPDIFRHKEA